MTTLRAWYCGLFLPESSRICVILNKRSIYISGRPSTRLAPGWKWFVLRYKADNIQRFVFCLLACVCALGSDLARAQSADPGSQSSSTYSPLSAGDRWRRYLDQAAFSPRVYFAVTAIAAVSQLEHDPPEWGQGITGYGRRSLSEFGVLTIQTTVHEGGAAVLGYDPRYLASDQPGFWHRTGHAVKWSFLTKNAAGSTRFDVPAVAGAYGGGMLSMFWYPHRFNPVSDGVRIGSQQVAYAVGVNIFREFSPELKRIFHRP
jgi:hypothetical protein